MARLATLLLVLLVLSTAGLPWSNNWPMFKHDLTRTGRNLGAGPLSPHLIWKYATDSGVFTGSYSSPAVVDNIVYVGSNNGSFYAIYANNGSLLWTYVTGGDIDSSPAVSNGIVYFGSWDGNVYALNASTGAKIWNYTTISSNSIVYSSPAVYNGIVYIGANDNNTYALNASTGVKIWNYSTGDIIRSSPAVYNGVVYVGSVDYNVYALNASTGAKIWNYTTGGIIDQSSPAIADGVLYIGSNDYNVYALNVSTGVRIWNYSTGGSIQSSPTVAGGVVYVGSGDNNLYALNATTGAKIWNYTTGGSVDSSPAVVNGVVYFGSGDNKIYALNASTGAVIWVYTTGNSVWSSPAVVNGALYVGSYDNYLYAVGTDVYVDRCTPLNISGVTYHLVANLSSVQGSCFSPANDTVLDCGGNRIEGDGTGLDAGIKLASRNNVTIRNCNVSLFETGIHVQDSNNVVVEDSESRDCKSAFGSCKVFYLYASKNVSISDSSLYNGEASLQANPSGGGYNLSANNLYGYNVSLYLSGDNSTTISGLNLTGDSKLSFSSQVDELRFNVQNSYINGKPIYWIKNKNGYSVPADAGVVGIIDSSNVNASGLVLDKNKEYSLVIGNSSYINLVSLTLANTTILVTDYSNNISVSGSTFDNASFSVSNSVSNAYNITVESSSFYVDGNADTWNTAVEDGGCMAYGFSVSNVNITMVNDATGVYYCTDGSMTLSNVRITGTGRGIDIDGDPSYPAVTLSQVTDSSSVGVRFLSPAVIDGTNFSKLYSYATVNISNAVSGFFQAGDQFTPGTINLLSNTSLDGVGMTGSLVNKTVYKVSSPPAGYPADANKSISKYVNITNNTAFYGVFSFRMYYSSSDLVAVNESTLRCYWYNESSGAWENVSASSVNTAENYVECNTTHFSVFGVFGQALPDNPPSVTLSSPSDGATVQPGNITFTYVPSDDYGLVNCTLWANFSGSWQANQTDTSPVNGTANNFTVSGLSEGVYTWNVQCYDNRGQEGWASSNYTLTVSSQAGQVSGAVSVVSAPGTDLSVVILLFAAAILLLASTGQIK